MSAPTITIDFGPIPFTTYALGPPVEGYIIRVPRKGDLATLDLTDTGLDETDWKPPAVLELTRSYAATFPGAGAFSISVLTTVTSSTKSRRNDLNDLGSELRCVWLPERTEWIVVVKSFRIEEDGMADHRCSGPYALNDWATRMILEAFGAGETSFPLESVRGLSPGTLGKTLGTKKSHSS